MSQIAIFWKGDLRVHVEKLSPEFLRGALQLSIGRDAKDKKSVQSFLGQIKVSVVQMKSLFDV